MFQGVFSPGPLTSLSLVIATYTVGVAIVGYKRYVLRADASDIGFTVACVDAVAFVCSFGFEFIQVRSASRG